MIKVELYKAKRNLKYNRNGTFLEDEIYLGRDSKNGDCFVLKSEEGYWNPLIRYGWAKNGSIEFHNNFIKVGAVFFKNRKELNKK